MQFSRVKKVIRQRPKLLGLQGVAKCRNKLRKIATWNRFQWKPRSVVDSVSPLSTAWVSEDEEDVIAGRINESVLYSRSIFDDEDDEDSVLSTPSHHATIPKVHLQLSWRERLRHWFRTVIPIGRRTVYSRELVELQQPNSSASGVHEDDDDVMSSFFSISTERMIPLQPGTTTTKSSSYDSSGDAFSGYIEQTLRRDDETFPSMIHLSDVSTKETVSMQSSFLLAVSFDEDYPQLMLQSSSMDDAASQHSSDPHIVQTDHVLIISAEGDCDNAGDVLAGAYDNGNLGTNDVGNIDDADDDYENHGPLIQNHEWNNSVMIRPGSMVLSDVKYGQTCLDGRGDVDYESPQERGQQRANLALKLSRVEDDTKVWSSIDKRADTVHGDVDSSDDTDDPYSEISMLTISEYSQANHRFYFNNYYTHTMNEITRDIMPTRVEMKPNTNWNKTHPTATVDPTPNPYDDYGDTDDDDMDMRWSFSDEDEECDVSVLLQVRVDFPFDEYE